MNVCPRCGTQNAAYATVCSSCGTPFSAIQPTGNQPYPMQPYPMQPAVSSGMKIGISILSVFVPIVGLILGLIYMNDQNPDKKAAGKIWLIVSLTIIGINLLCVCGYFIVGAMLVGGGAAAGG